MSLARCIYNCEDNSDCEASCVEQFKTRTEDCPCEVGPIFYDLLTTFFIPLNNLGCEIIIKDNCPAGCPCDSFECEDVTPTVTSTTSVATTTTKPAAKEAVLMLSTYEASNIPMVINYNGGLHDVTYIKSFLSYRMRRVIYKRSNNLGEVDDDINFTYDINTEVEFSCAASLNDDMWVLGGNIGRQVNL